jgi:nascent polypeptide-associated complex subunit alpha
MDPRKMQQMMEQMGIDMTEIDAEEIVIRTADEELVFENTSVRRMDAQGQETYMIADSPSETRERGGTETGDTTAESSADASAEESDDDAIPQDDVDLVAQRAGVSESAAREALEATDGDLAAALARLE